MTFFITLYTNFSGYYYSTNSTTPGALWIWDWPRAKFLIPYLIVIIYLKVVALESQVIEKSQRKLCLILEVYSRSLEDTQRFKHLLKYIVLFQSLVCRISNSNHDDLLIWISFNYFQSFWCDWNTTSTSELSYLW